MSDKYWTMRDGTKILIKDMTDAHLMNTIKMLRRNVEFYKLQRIAMELEYYEPYTNDEEFLLAHIDTYGDLINELMKRGLVIDERENN